MRPEAHGNCERDTTLKARTTKDAAWEAPLGECATPSWDTLDAPQTMPPFGFMRSGPEAQKTIRAKHRLEAHKMPRVECRVVERKLPQTRRCLGSCVMPGVRYCQKPLEKPPARRRSGSLETPCTRHILRRKRIRAQYASHRTPYTVRRARDAKRNEEESTWETLAGVTQDTAY